MVDDDNPNGRDRLDATDLAMKRIRRFARYRIRPAVYTETRPVTVTSWTVGGEPVPFGAAIEQRFSPFAVGEPWGRPWDTVWFDVRGEVPADWDPQEAELLVDLGFVGGQPGFTAEATAYRPDGSIVKAVEPLNAWVPLSNPGPFQLLLEAAANPLVQIPYEYEPTLMGDWDTAGDDPVYRLERLEVARRDRVVWELLQDVEVLDSLVDVLPRDGSRRAELVHALERMVDLMNPEDVPGTAAEGRRVLANVLSRPAAQSSLVVHAVGHAHIDSAWLWPSRETVRKVARTFANVLDLMDRNPDFVFAASSAQQYAWLKATQPELYARLRKAVAAGRFRPVGGMWVESDTNMPSGESLVRQLVFGKRFFLEEFGVESDEVWLPDSFGYTAALPQIIRAAGSRFFLTQKPSWNEVNRMPYSTFLWEGIDGSRVFTHFPPAETYNSDLGANDLARTERVFAEKGRAQQVLGLYGWGNGGGGPTREMLATAARKRDLDGSPRVRLSDPASFFQAAERELEAPAVWLGEMYLELHRGTLISQQRTKRGNRHSEALLHEAELWSATAAVRAGAAYPYDAIEAAWRTVLLQQFHDILPGSSIAWVHREAEREYGRVARELEGVIAEALDALPGRGEGLLANAGPVARAAVPAFGVGRASVPVPAEARTLADGFLLEDDWLRVEVDSSGLLRSVRDCVADREVLPQGMRGGVLQLFRDTPREWDAWDINEEDQRDGRDLDNPVSVVADRDSLRIRHEVGATRIDVVLRLVAGRLEYAFDIDWQASQKLLKLAFPVDVRAERANAEIQFGHLSRATHRNTSWDSARFETVAHRWIQVGEPDWGVAIANDVVYGHDVRTLSAPSGRPMVLARLSLLRAPRYPDPQADLGSHAFTVSFRPGGISEAIEDGFAQSLPLRPAPAMVAPLVAVNTPAVVIDTVKLADDRSGDVVLRLHEAAGSRVRARLRADFPWSAAMATDLLERPIESESIKAVEIGIGLEVVLRPFELLTVRFKRTGGHP